MIEDFEVKKEIFENLPHGSIHFSLCLEGKPYSGLYMRSEIKVKSNINKKGEINWFHPQPDRGNHNIAIDEVESQIHNLMNDYIQ